MHVVIDQGKTLILKLIASGPVNVATGMRDVLFEMNGEMRAVQVEDKSAATETFKAERSTGEPGSIGCKLARSSRPTSSSLDQDTDHVPFFSFFCSSHVGCRR